MLRVNHNQAEKILVESVAKVAQATSYTPSSGFAKTIKAVMLGDHKTFRYILLTGLLAKAAEPNVNALALQAGAPIKNAYDARSLCHKVIVPNEKLLFQGRLGASNEPFLNKPARFTHLSIENAVRKGSDLETLKRLISILGDESLANQIQAALDDAVFYILQRPARKKETITKTFGSNEDDIVGIYKFLDIFLTHSFEGESTVIALGAVLRCLYAMNDAFEVRVHPTNQAGSSSNEICDIDILFVKDPLFGVEVKDKEYSDHDVIHALDKARDHGLKRMLFVEGRHVTRKAPSVTVDDIYYYNLKIDDCLQGFLSGCPPITKSEFLSAINEVAIDIRAKDSTYSWLQDCIQKATG